MTQEKTEAKKPEFEMFFGKEIKAFCGVCGRCVWIAIHEKPDVCKWCGTPVDWREQE